MHSTLTAREAFVALHKIEEILETATKSIKELLQTIITRHKKGLNSLSCK
eukprot:m.136 g.136  ORF g.136 m.136 type:complete len:50 (+) comp749_c0_seq1:188-337(+)